MQHQHVILPIDGDTDTSPSCHWPAASATKDRPHLGTRLRALSRACPLNTGRPIPTTSNPARTIVSMPRLMTFPATLLFNVAITRRNKNLP